MTPARDPALADKIIAFLNCLPIVDGPAAGQRFHVDEWMERFIRDVYEPVNRAGRRRVRSAILSCARKNAKSYLIAGLILAHLVGPAAVPYGQIFSAAVDHVQARIVFEMCAKIIEMMPALQRVIRVRDHLSTIEVIDQKRASFGSKYKALSAVVASKHGLGADFFVYDEFAEAKNGDLWDVLFDSQQARANPLGVAISTQNDNPNHPFTQMIDIHAVDPSDDRVVHVYAAPEGCALDDRDAWLAANPALATWKSYDAIEAAANEAIRNPAKEANFRLRYLNQRVSAETQFFTAATVLAANPGGVATPASFTQSKAWQFKSGEPIYIGVDIAKRTDFTAITAVSASNPNRVKSWFFKPADLIAEHSKRDHQPYDLWAKNGWIITPEGETVPGAAIADKLIELIEAHDVQALVYDFNHADDVIRHISDAGYSVGNGHQYDLRAVKWGNGGNDAAKAVNAIEDAFLRGQVELDGNPVMNMCLANAVVDTDSMDRRKFVKGKATQRIDGAVALSIAMAVKTFDINEKPAVSPWEANPEFEILLI